MRVSSLSARFLSTFSALVLAFGLLCLLSACRGYKSIPYLRDVPDTLRGAYTAPVSPYQDLRIQPDDILQISIQTIDAQVNSQLASGNGMSYSTQPAFPASPTGSPTPTGSSYLVDKTGFIEIPLTGRLYVAGLTTEQARDTIRQQAALYYKTPVVNVRYANFQITVLGEVVRPATYVVPNERVDVLQALGMAGDLTIFGKRENVLVIREENGQKTFARLNLNSSEMFQSPFFQLRQRDVIYVEPSKNKSVITDASQTRLIALLGTVGSVLIVLFSRIRF